MQSESFCLQNESKSACLLSAGRPICFTLVSLSLARSLSLSPSCSPLLFQTHTNTRAHTRGITHLNGRTPLVLRRLLLLRADEMKEQLASIASSNRSRLAGRQNASTATRHRRFGSPSAVRRAPRALRHPPLLSPPEIISTTKYPAHLSSVRAVYREK